MPEMKVINCPHEQVAGHFADGHTRITRKPAVCLVGPEGFANAVPAMMEAWGERSPVIFVTGSSTLKRQGSGGFKEIDDVAIAEPLTKYSASITDGDRISEFVDRAYKIAMNGYPGAVHLSLPVDIMFSAFAENSGREERPFDEIGTAAGKKHGLKPARLKLVMDRLAGARRPVLTGWAWRLVVRCGRISGGGRAQTWHSRVQHPLSSEIAWRGNVRPHMGLGRHSSISSVKVDAFAEADLVLMVGARLDNQMNFGNPPLFPESVDLVCINGSHEEVDFNRAADFTLLSDPGSAFLQGVISFGVMRGIHAGA